MPSPELRVMISGGGTGGHIFPAIAIATAVKRLRPSAEILFVGAKGKMEMEKVPAAGFRIEGLWIAGLQRRLTLQNMLFPVRLLSSLWKAARLIRTFRPDVVVGVGGYASGPLLYMATARKIPSIIQEQNSFPGITNRMLSRRVDKIAVAYPDMEKYFPPGKIMFTGNPVRQDLLEAAGRRQEAVNYFGLDPSLKTILVVGGSLGARTINESMHQGLKKINEAGIQLIWQTGKAFALTAKEAVEPYGAKLKCMDFISRMDLAYAAADLVVSRAGAASISELAVVGKPVILVPSPNVSEDHQTKNAMALVSRQAAVLVRDSEARTMLVDKAISLVRDTEQCSALSRRVGEMAKTNAAAEIAEELFRLAQ